MAKRGWHLNSMIGPPGVHIACTVSNGARVYTLTYMFMLFSVPIFKRLTVPIVDTFLADLKYAVREAKLSPSGKGSKVMLYGQYSVSIS
jgi:sphinganine-1-phosphate aldolase